MNKLKVRVGEHDVSSLSEPIRHDEIDVDQVIVHPQVRAINVKSMIAKSICIIQFNNNTLANDMALIRLAEPVKKKTNINIVCLPAEDTFSDDDLLSTKW